jgi:hypothetical protein
MTFRSLTGSILSGESEEPGWNFGISLQKSKIEKPPKNGSKPPKITLFWAVLPVIRA